MVLMVFCLNFLWKSRFVADTERRDSPWSEWHQPMPGFVQAVGQQPLEWQLDGSEW